MMLKKYIFLAFIFLVVKTGLGQDIHFSQFYLVPTVLNAGAIGDAGTHRVSASYRDQWKSIAAPYKTSLFSYDTKCFVLKNEDKVGVGINVFSDQAGTTFKTSQVCIGSAYHKFLSPNHILSLGFQGGIRQHAFINNGKWGTQYNGKGYDPSMASGENFPSISILVPELNVGGIYKYVKSDIFMLCTGLSYHHVLGSNVSLEKANVKEHKKIVSTFSADIGVKGWNMIFIPKLLISRQGPYTEIVTGCLVKYLLGIDSKYTGYQIQNSISIGTLYRYNDAAIITSQMHFSSYVMGLSYDFNISSLKTASGGKGGPEIMIGYVFRDRNITVKRVPSF